jgi:hypothetical protein
MLYLIILIFIIEFSKKLFIIKIENILVFDLKKSSQVAILWEG